jgi:hypothetical protein
VALALAAGGKSIDDDEDAERDVRAGAFVLAEIALAMRQPG